MKYVFITGGVVSGLGKGITAASLGRLLKARGLKVQAQKLDPYINVDPGTMSPFQHGEVYVTEDGAETDLDLGHYERFIDENLNKFSNLTSGKVYWNVLHAERQGDYLGSTVQVIPHVTDEIKSFIYQVGEQSQADVVLTEIGGTIGDIESLPFIEAVRQVSHEIGRENCIFIHVTLVPYLNSSKEHKTKPTQHSVKALQSYGVNPDILVLRADEEMEAGIIKKITQFCNIPEENVFTNITLPTLYEAPMMLEEQNFSTVVCKELGIDLAPIDLSDWEAMLSRIKEPQESVEIALVGKYVQLHDAYLSVAEALRHGGYTFSTKVNIHWIDSEAIEGQDLEDSLDQMDAIIVPGGFGERGIEGILQAIRFGREKEIPLFGICLGMQLMVVEYARNVLGFADANSGEFNPDSAHKVIDLMADKANESDMGGTLRLGAYPCVIEQGTTLAKAYGEDLIHERHRHRYEFNNTFREEFEKAGLCLAGHSEDGRLIEAVELSERDFYLGVQYHPEFKSRPNKAHPLFQAFIEAAIAHKKEKHS